jgi:hypothetical protein
MTRGSAFAARYRALIAALAVIALSAFAYAPLFGDGMILTGDTLHAVRIYEMRRCIDDGQLPCRWAPDLGNGHGLPLFNYYPPLPYYAGDALHRLGLSYLDAVDALYVIGLAGAGLSMFLLGRRLWGDAGGIVSGVAYVYAPYLALDSYMRGALAELWALAAVPALLWALHALISSGKARYVPLAALFGALLLLSHNLVAVIVAPLVAVWIAGLLYVHRDSGVARPLALTAGAGAWAFGLAAFFTLPVLFEGDLVQLDNLSRGVFHYSNHFVSPGDLLFERSDDYGFLVGARGDTPVQTGWAHLALAAAALPAAALLVRAGRRVEAFAVGAFAAAFATGAFMSTAASKPVWDAFDPLRFLQFPWRYVGLVSLASAAMAGAWLALLRGRPAAQLALAAGLVALLIGLNQTFFDPLLRFDYSDDDVLTGERFAFYQGGSISDYLPEAAEEAPPLADAPSRIVRGDARIEAPVQESDRLRLRVDAGTPATVEASVFDFPNWRVRVDGERVAHEASGPYGLITFDLPAGGHDVELRLEDTAVRTAGNWLSLASWLALVLTPVGFVASRRRR